MVQRLLKWVFRGNPGQKESARVAKGRFIVLEGPDGCGKSTQAGILRERLLGAGREVEVVRDPGGTPIGEAIREILLNPEYEKMSVRTELLL